MSAVKLRKRNIYKNLIFLSPKRWEKYPINPAQANNSPKIKYKISEYNIATRIVWVIPLCFGFKNVKNRKYSAVIIRELNNEYSKLEE